MNKVKVNLKNCYGIKSLEKEFDFSGSPAYAIYAPNGVMKSSFASTFLNASKGEKSCDRIFNDRKTVREITDDTGAEIDPNHILVVLPYNQFFDLTPNTATLLIDPKLRKEFSSLVSATNDAKLALLESLRKQSGSKRDFQLEITRTFTDKKDGDATDLGLTRITRELKEQVDAPYADVKYEVIFNEKVETALDTPDLRSAISDYVLRYNDLLSKSTYFKKGTFDYYNAAQIAKSLADNGFFSARHSVSLNAETGNQSITTQAELESVITKEKDAILKDASLKKKFDDVAKKLNKNAELRDFCAYLQTKEELLSRLDNLKEFRGEVLKSYLKANQDRYLDWLSKFDAAAARRKEMEAQAAQTTSEWEKVIDIFNDRFTVPFTLSAKNKIALTLGYESIIDLEFTYKDGDDSTPIDKAKLIDALSNGEKKALYILYLIFEIQTRRTNGTETLVIVDDIADSFDYQNKYAIIHYLKDTSEDKLFKLIIMTHNFDFFRTIESRFVEYSQCLMASRGSSGITLNQATAIRNPFLNEWKGKFFSNARMKIACIPFLRNLVEMTIGNVDADYLKLTSMLHWKAGTTEKLTVKDLDDTFLAICRQGGTSPDGSKLVVDLIKEEAQACAASTAPALSLENKIVLAIGIRLSAERFMIDKIADPAFLGQIKKDQMPVLVSKYKTLATSDANARKILDQVALMTPENIHVNSFMYEPIIDMGDIPLRKLFGKVLALK